MGDFMENLDLSKITLMESGLCAYDSSYLSVLRSNGINYVSQILDDELMNNLYLKLRSSAVRTRELKGFVSLAKYKYMGIIDPEVMRLDETVNICIKESHGLSVEPLYTLGLRDSDSYVITRNLRRCKDFNPKKKYTYREILKLVYPFVAIEKTTIRGKRVAPCMQLILEQYDRNLGKVIQDEEQEDLEELRNLREQLVRLTAERNSLNKLIADVQAKITLIENTKMNGGIKK